MTDESMQAVMTLATKTKARFASSLKQMKKRNPDLDLSEEDFEWIRESVSQREFKIVLDRTTKVKWQLDVQNEIFP